MQIVFCNQALCRLTGHDDEYLTELTCVYQSATDLAPERQLANGLSPPPDGFDREPFEGWVTIPSTAGPRFHTALFVPSRSTPDDSDGDFYGILVFVVGPPLERPDLSLTKSETPDHRQLHMAIRQMQYESARGINIDCLVGHSPVSQKIRQQIEIASQIDASLLIAGPSGSQRRNVANLIHYANGPELVGPLMPFQCPVGEVETVQEIVKQIYRDHHQYPEEPLGRILLLEVDAMPEAAQNELLGFLTLPDFRLPLFATAGPDFREKIVAGLQAHLTPIVIELPALSQRREDIPFLAQAVVEQLNDAHHAQIAGFDDEAMRHLVRYAWPGDLKELTETVSAAWRSATPPTIRFQDLPSHIRIAMQVDREVPDAEKPMIQLDQFLAEMEFELIQRAVNYAAGNKSEAARLLGISRARLLRRLDDVGDAETVDESGAS